MKNRTEYKKVCEYCGKNFIAYRYSTRLCGAKCNDKVVQARKREETKLKYANKPKSKIFRKPKDTIHPEFLSITATAQLLGVSRPTIYKMIKNQQLHPIRISERVIRIKKSEIEQLNIVQPNK